MKNTTIAIAAALASALITLPAWAEEHRPPGLPKPDVIFIPAQPAPDMRQQQGQRTTVRTGSNTLRAETNLSLTSVHEAQERDPVNSAFAPGMAVSNGTCFGSSGAGLTVTGFSVSGGSPTLDKGCDARYDAASLIAVGDVESAMERLCMKPEIREARRNAGKPCLADTPSAPGATFTEVCLDPSGQPYTDPQVIARACPAK